MLIADRIHPRFALFTPFLSLSPSLCQSSPRIVVGPAASSEVEIDAVSSEVEVDAAAVVTVVSPPSSPSSLDRIADHFKLGFSRRSSLQL
jgi:hypothetical protein